MILVHSADSGELTVPRRGLLRMGYFCHCFLCLLDAFRSIMADRKYSDRRSPCARDPFTVRSSLPPEPAQCTKIKVALLKSQITFTYSVPKLFSRYFTKNSKPSEMFLTVLYFACFEHHRMT